jgi:hypothetical protein
MKSQSEDKEVWLLANKQLQQLNTASCYPRRYWISYHTNETCTCHLSPCVADIREHIWQQWEQKRNVLSHQLRYHCLTHWLDQDLHTKQELKSLWKLCNVKPKVTEQEKWYTKLDIRAICELNNTRKQEEEKSVSELCKYIFSTLQRLNF